MGKTVIKSPRDPAFLKLGLVITLLGVIVIGLSIILGFPVALARPIVGLGLAMCILHYVMVRMKKNPKEE
jgi:hypothetical protein